MTALLHKIQQKNPEILQHVATTGPLCAVTAGKMKKVLSGALIFASITISALVLWTVAYNYRERLSDRQLIAIAAGREVERRVGSVNYASLEDLINRNPVCCIVLHSNHEWLRFPYQIFEEDDAVVLLNYIVNNDPKEKYFSAEVAISSKGDVLRSRGTTTDLQPLR